jgi:hypothetical protein
MLGSDNFKSLEAACGFFNLGFVEGVVVCEMSLPGGDSVTVFFADQDPILEIVVEAVRGVAVCLAIEERHAVMSHFSFHTFGLRLTCP